MWIASTSRGGLVLALLLSGLPLYGQADVQTPVAREAGLAARSLMVDAATAGTRLVVVGDRGQVLYSDDQGQHWLQASVPGRQLLTAVYFADASHGWAVGHDAQILATRDAGTTWALQFTEPKREAPLLDVWFQNTQKGFAVGSYGALLATTDGGEHWADASDRLDNPDQYHLNAIAAVPGAGLFIVGEQGSVFRSTDDGDTWQAVASPYQGSLFGVIGTGAPGTLLAYGLRGNLFRSTDAGNSWQPVAVNDDQGPLEATLSGATLLADGTLLVVGSAGSVLRSNDGGEHFSVVNRPDRQALAAVAGKADGSLVLVGQGGIHLASATGVEVKQP